MRLPKNPIVSISALVDVILRHAHIPCYRKLVLLPINTLSYTVLEEKRREKLCVSNPSSSSLSQGAMHVIAVPQLMSKFVEMSVRDTARDLGRTI